MLRSRLPRIARELDSQLEPALREIAVRIAVGAKARVPVDTGALRDAIHVERVDESTYLVVAGNGDVYYGHMVENGTVREAPRPFLIPAAESARDNIDEAARRALGNL